MAMVELELGQQLDDGFLLAICLAEIHVPRMWVEQLPDSSHRVRMLARDVSALDSFHVFHPRHVC